MSAPSTWQTIRTLLTPRRIVILAIAGVLFLAVLWWIRQFIELTPQGLRNLMAPFGWWGGLLLSGIIAFILVVPVAPATIAQVGAGLLYGPWIGFGVTMLGDVIGSLLGFAIARRWGRQTFLYTRLSSDEKAAFDRLCQQITPLRLIVLRILPGTSLYHGIARCRVQSVAVVALPASIVASVPPGLALLTLAGDLSTSQPWLAGAVGVGFVLLMLLLNKVAHKYNNSL
jgi:uncharacterized membrane protein YdjX (TVP38/TMEM64 family)